MTANNEATRDRRFEIAAAIVGLSNNLLSTKNNRGYIALKVGNRVAVSVHDDRASFFIPSTELLGNVKAQFQKSGRDSATQAQRQKLVSDLGPRPERSSSSGRAIPSGHSRINGLG